MHIIAYPIHCYLLLLLDVVFLHFLYSLFFVVSFIFFDLRFFVRRFFFASLLACCLPGRNFRWRRWRREWLEQFRDRLTKSVGGSGLSLTGCHCQATTGMHPRFPHSPPHATLSHPQPHHPR